MYRKIRYIKYDRKTRFTYVSREKTLVEMDTELHVIILINIGVTRFEKKDN